MKRVHVYWKCVLISSMKTGRKEEERNVWKSKETLLVIIWAMFLNFSELLFILAALLLVTLEGVFFSMASLTPHCFNYICENQGVVEVVKYVLFFWSTCKFKAYPFSLRFIIFASNLWLLNTENKSLPLEMDLIPQIHCKTTPTDLRGLLSYNQSQYITPGVLTFY